MKVIDQSHKFLYYTDLLKLVEIAGRICYKSEDKITDNSANAFVRRIRKSGHHSVLEHAHVCFKFHSVTGYTWMKHHQLSKYFTFTPDRLLVSGNFRTWMEFLYKCTLDDKSTPPQDITKIAEYLHLAYPTVFTNYFSITLNKPYTSFKESEMTTLEKLAHTTRTCKFTTNRGVTHEIVRHRPWAYSQTSTRYVNYGSKDMEFIKPVWMGTSRYIQTLHWRNAMEQCEESYRKLLVEGWKPEQARDVLPNALKTEIVCTATLADWKHMLDLRTSKAAHPQIRALMKPVLKELHEELPDVFL